MIAARRIVLIVFLLVAGCGHSASAAKTFVDKHVSAISQASLLKASPRSLLDEHRQQISLRFTALTRPLFFVWAFAMIGASLYLWMTGRAAKLRDVLKRRIRSPALVRFAYGVALAGIVGTAGLPVAFIRYRIAVLYDLTTQPAHSWLRDQFLTIGLDAFISGLVVVFVLTLVARTSFWYIYTAAGIVCFSFVVNYIEPVMISPLYNTYRLLPESNPIASRLHDLERRAGLVGVPIYVDDQSKQTAVVNANVSGYGAMRRIVLGDNLLAETTPGEVLFITAHEMGHSVRNDVFRLTLFGTCLLLVTATLAVVLADRVGFRRDDDPLSRLALVTALLGIIGLVMFPAYNTYSRGIEARADSFGLALSGEHAAAVRAFVRFADEGLAPYCPPQLVRAYFYDHPPIGSRIAAVLVKPDPCP
jgi:STE24 endopeptidase